MVHRFAVSNARRWLRLLLEELPRRHVHDGWHLLDIITFAIFVSVDLVANTRPSWRIPIVEVRLNGELLHAALRLNCTLGLMSRGGALLLHDSRRHVTRDLL